ncbi:MAG: hypothetical protein KDD37_10320 [Bdellovibrionales bacterium]|nr:hypothetical protein [Bdellovibrionales bacterium]
MKYPLFVISFIASVSCTTGGKLNTDIIADRLADGENVTLSNQSKTRSLYLHPHYDRNLGARSVVIKDMQDKYNSIPFLVLDKAVEAELLACREPLKADCLDVFTALISRLDWPYVIVKEGDSLSAIAARECGGSKNVKIIRKYNYPYGECEGKADRLDQGLCLSISQGIPIRIPPTCNK